MPNSTNSASVPVPLMQRADSCLCAARRIRNIVSALNERLYGACNPCDEAKEPQQVNLDFQLGTIERLLSDIELNLESIHNRTA